MHVPNTNLSELSEEQLLKLIQLGGAATAACILTELDRKISPEFITATIDIVDSPELLADSAWNESLGPHARLRLALALDAPHLIGHIFTKHFQELSPEEREAAIDNMGYHDICYATAKADMSYEQRLVLAGEAGSAFWEEEENGQEDPSCCNAPCNKDCVNTRRCLGIVLFVWFTLLALILAWVIILTLSKKPHDVHVEKLVPVYHTIETTHTCILPLPVPLPIPIVIKVPDFPAQVIKEPVVFPPTKPEHSILVPSKHVECRCCCGPNCTCGPFCPCCGKSN